MKFTYPCLRLPLCPTILRLVISVKPLVAGATKQMVQTEAHFSGMNLQLNRRIYFSFYFVESFFAPKDSQSISAEKLV